jgi:serine/threonine protein kinase
MRVPVGFGLPQYRDPAVEDMALYPSFVDVYSFGKILAQMLLGSGQFHSENDSKIREARERNRISRLAWLCVQTQTNERPTMAQVVQELERFGPIGMFERSNVLFNFELQHQDPDFDIGEQPVPVI